MRKQEIQVESRETKGAKSSEGRLGKGEKGPWLIDEDNENETKSPKDSTVVGSDDEEV